MKKKIILFLVLAVIIGGVGMWYYVFVYSKNHHRNAADENAISIQAVEIVKQYGKDEIAANAKYLDKAVDVTGEVAEVSANQEGFVTVSLKSEDAMSTVFCTLKEKSSAVKVGQLVTIKGICIGYISDVRIKDAVIIK